jgi:predicted O-linked N-acetylglucosamine transferase (SPINDLY family)
VTDLLRQSADRWRDVCNLTEVQISEVIRDDGIDILVDLAMHTAGDLLQVFARRPAPVQVSWLAYPGSTGMEAIDYRLTDALIDPPGEADPGPGGEPVRLPDAWCCYAPLKLSGPVGPLHARQNGVVTFGALNQFSKVHEDLMRCWARVLNAVPGSRLIMICPPGEARLRVRALLASEGLSLDRVELVAYSPWPEYARLFERIDLALDTFPCNGMTTTCHALWMGVPVVTRAGMSPVSRAGKSLLQVIGRSEWVARSEEEYVAIATSWANDLPRLEQSRLALRQALQASPLMDGPRFARNMEKAFRTMWQRWCRKEQT